MGCCKSQGSSPMESDRRQPSLDCPSPFQPGLEGAGPRGFPIPHSLFPHPATWVR